MPHRPPVLPQEHLLPRRKRIPLRNRWMYRSPGVGREWRILGRNLGALPPVPRVRGRKSRLPHRPKPRRYPPKARAGFWIGGKWKESDCYGKICSYYGSFRKVLAPILPSFFGKYAKILDRTEKTGYNKSRITQRRRAWNGWNAPNFYWEETGWKN